VAVGSAGQSPFGGHAGRVLTVAFRPGGFLAATGGYDGTIRIWDVGTREQRAQLEGHIGPVKSVAYSPDAAVIASAGDDWTVRIWDAGTGEQRAQLTGHTGPVQSVVYSRDGEAIATAGDDRTVRIWDAVTGELLRHLAPRPGAVNSVAFSPDGELVACAGSDRAVWIWRIRADSEPRRLTGHLSKVNAVAFSPDGRLIASAGGVGFVKIWDAHAGSARFEFRESSATVNALAFSPDGQAVASAGDNGKVLIWNLSTGQPLGQLEGHGARVNCVAYSPIGTAMVIATASDDGTARVWEVASRNERHRLAGHTGPVKSVAYSPDGHSIATAGADRQVRIWDAKTGSVLAPPLGHDQSVTAMAYSPTNPRMVTVDEGATIRIWDLTNGQNQTLEIGHRDSVNAVAYRLDGNAFATASDDQTILIRDAASRRHGIQLKGHRGPVSSVAYRRDGSVVSGGHDGTVRVWERDTGKPLAEFSGIFTEVRSIACSLGEGSAAIAAAGGDGIVLVWDVDTGGQLARIDGHGGPVYSMAYDPAGSVIATACGDGTVKIWDANTFKQRSELTGHVSAVQSLAFNPDGTRIATCGYDGTIRVWDAHTGEQIAGSGFGVPRARHLPLAGVSSDSPSAVDLIGIGRDVDTLAELIAATETRAPLAIALIGEWGAGKSSLMELVDAQVGRLAEVSRNNRGATAFATSVCQIHFNAWHYSSDHLWAGVAREMFQALMRSDWQESAAEIDSDAGKLHAERAKLRAELASCERDTERLTSELENVKSAEPPGGVLRSLGSPSYVARTFAYAYREGFKDVRSSWIALLIWVALAAVIAVAWLFFGPQIKILITVIVGAAAALLPMLKRLRSWQQMLMVKTNILYQDLVRKKSELQQRTADLQERLALVDAQFRLSEFVRNRGNSTVYRKGRGLVGDVHEDLLVLSDSLRQARIEWRPDDGQPEPPERIVLYIDDLDRCPLDRVVEMLEAVHLILTLDLFIVVVAVDARWMIRSLESHYQAFFADGGTVAGNPERLAAGHDRIAPYDYLDKIFQIPYTLIPPRDSESARYLRSLLPEPRLSTGSRSSACADDEDAGPPAKPSAAPEGEPDTYTRRTGIRQSRQNAGQSPADHGEASAATEGGSAMRAGSGDQLAGSRAVPDLQPPSLWLSHAEVEFMTRLGTLTPSPRAAKRMANLYRLVRISIPDEELAAFLGDASGGPYRAVQVLIAILAGAPEIAHELFERILAANEVDGLLAALGLDNGQPREEGDLLADIGAKLKRLNDEIGLPPKISEYQRWCPELARYSFRTWRLARDLAARR
jgi:WD40 repeat protein